MASAPALLASLGRPARALVVGASGGIGSAVTKLLAGAGFEAVHALSRSGMAPDAPGIVGGRIDIEDEASIAAALEPLREGAPLRLVFVATGLLHDGSFQPEKTYRALDGEALARSFRVNAIGPALVAKHALPLLPREDKSVFAAISARVGSIEDNQIGGWYAYRAAKAALNQLVRTMAIEVKRQKPEAVCVALHPGTVDTRLSAPFQAGVKPEKLFPPETSALRLLNVLDALNAADSGQLFAWDGERIPF